MLNIIKIIISKDSDKIPLTGIFKKWSNTGSWFFAMKNSSCGTYMHTPLQVPRKTSPAELKVFQAWINT